MRIETDNFEKSQTSNVFFFKINLYSHSAVIIQMILLYKRIVLLYSTLLGKTYLYPHHTPPVVEKCTPKAMTNTPRSR